MAESQDEIFADFEADGWFDRNRESLAGTRTAEEDVPLRIMDLYGIRPRSVLEIGAANGYRLAAIRERSGPDVRLVAVEPSGKAIEDGRRRFPDVEFHRGTASAVPLDESFDLIIVHFVFHWIDRLSLLRSVAEVDRLLADGGFLILGDFFPSNYTRVKYHHLPGREVFTYKQDYAAVFRATGIYRPVCLLTRSHDSQALDPAAEEDGRVGVWLLRKALRDSYSLRSLGE